MRGKLRNFSLNFILTRITPACAGKTVAIILSGTAFADHPRVCGENRCKVGGGCTCGGSPPRVRGKLLNHLYHCHIVRITPACAGKTQLCRLCPAPFSDHPRVCGENARKERMALYCVGSPPRVRGKRCADCPLRRPRRITPACAGKTLRKWRISVVDPSPQPRSSLTSRRAGASIGSQRAPCAAPV